MDDLERQIKLEADAVQDGVARLIQRRKYQLATDTKPVRDLMANAWESLVKAILQEQLALKSSERQKLPKYGAALLCLTAEKPACPALVSSVLWAYFLRARLIPIRRLPQTAFWRPTPPHNFRHT